MKTNWMSVLHNGVGHDLLESGFKRHANGYYVRVVGEIAQTIRYDTMRSVNQLGGRVRPEFLVTHLPLLNFLKPFTKYRQMKKFAWPCLYFWQLFETRIYSREQLKDQFGAQSGQYWLLGHGEWHERNLENLASASLDIATRHFLKFPSLESILGDYVRFEKSKVIPKGTVRKTDGEFIYVPAVYTPLSMRDICISINYIKNNLEACEEIINDFPRENHSSFDLEKFILAEIAKA